MSQADHEEKDHDPDGIFPALSELIIALLSGAALATCSSPQPC